MDQRCQELIGEGNDACNNVLGQITDRYNEIAEGATIEGNRMCEETKRLTVEMVRRGAESAFDSQLELGKQLAEAMFKEQVEEWLLIWLLSKEQRLRRCFKNV